ncbi:MAG: PrgI family protein [Patescibacteria group bacterium]
MQFQVPQFIEVEDKVVGPLTIKQFVYIAGGAGICVVFYVFIKPLFISIFLILPVAVLSLALAFFKINNKPFIQVLESAFYFTLREKLYIWKKEEKKIEAKKKETDESLNGLFSPRLSDSKLKDLAWSLDINERVKKNPKI